MRGGAVTDGSDRPQRDDASREGVFAMDPDETLRLLARQMVTGQQVMADMSRTAATLRADPSAMARSDTADLLAQFVAQQQQWFTETLPALAASMKLACEVYDTFGPGMTTIEDPLDAAIFNNKYFAWTSELTPRPTQ